MKHIASVPSLAATTISCLLLFPASVSAQTTLSANPMPFVDKEGNMYFCSGTSVTFTTTADPGPTPPTKQCCPKPGSNDSVKWNLDKDGRYQLIIEDQNGKELQITPQSGFGNSNTATYTTTIKGNGGEKQGIQSISNYMWVCSGDMSKQQTEDSTHAMINYQVWDNIPPASIPKPSPRSPQPFLFGANVPVNGVYTQNIGVVTYITRLDGTLNNIMATEAYNVVQTYASQPCGEPFNTNYTPPVYSYSWGAAVTIPGTAATPELSVGYSGGYSDPVNAPSPSNVAAPQDDHHYASVILYEQDVNWVSATFTGSYDKITSIPGFNTPSVDTEVQGNATNAPVALSTIGNTHIVNGYVYKSALGECCTAPGGSGNPVNGQ